MSKQWKNIQSQLFFITLSILVLGMVNINLTLIGLTCFTLPFYFYFKYKDKIWCKHICPRAGLFTRVVSKVNIGLKVPKWLTSKKMKYGVLIYFMTFMSFAVISAVLVGMGIKDLRESVNLFVVFNINNFPQLIDFKTVDWVQNFSYSLYSMLLTSTVFGAILGILFKPRTWCTICPMNTLTPIKKKPVTA